MNTAAWRVSQDLGLPLLLRGETFLGCVNGGRIKRWLHRLVFTRRFKRVSAFLPVGRLNKEFYAAYGVPERKLFDVPYCVDNAFFQLHASQATLQREALKAQLNIPPERPILLFCGKLIDVKDPATLIHAVATIAKQGRANSPVLLIVGDGHLRPELEALAATAPSDSIRFLGFQNQTQLPALYDLCDLFVLPSKFEPWGLVVNEVMNAGKPVIVSDQVGSGPDLVEPGVNGDIFTAGSVTELTAKLTHWLSNPALLKSGGTASLSKISHWGFPECLKGIQQAMQSLPK